MRCGVVRLVQGESKPLILLTLTDDLTGTPVNLSAATTVVTVDLKDLGTKETLKTIVCTKLGSGVSGQVQFDFSGGASDVPLGTYEGVVIVDFDGDANTLTSRIPIRVRENF